MSAGRDSQGHLVVPFVVMPRPLQNSWPQPCQAKLFSISSPVSGLIWRNARGPSWLGIEERQLPGASAYPGLLFHLKLPTLCAPPD